MHASGLTREVPPCPNCTQAEILAVIHNSTTMLAPTYARTHYSNLGIALLGRALEAVAGMSWEQWVTTRIAAPMGLSRTGWSYDQWMLPLLVDGVDPATGEKSAVPAPGERLWAAPAGAMYASVADMAAWTDLLGGLDAAGLKSLGLRPTSLLEMRNTGIMQNDGLSAVSSSTLENAFMQGHWTFNKLGCQDGYRSAINAIPSLGLSIYGAAASTCDNFGDGDAITFPVASLLIPVMASHLKREAAAAAAAALALVAVRPYLGTYCGAGGPVLSLGVDGQLYLSPGPSGYNLVLLFDGNEDKSPAVSSVLSARTGRFWPGRHARDAARRWSLEQGSGAIESAAAAAAAADAADAANAGGRMRFRSLFYNDFLDPSYPGCTDPSVSNNLCPGESEDMEDLCRERAEKTQ